MDDGTLLQDVNTAGWLTAHRPPGQAQPLAVAYGPRTDAALNPADVQPIDVTVHNRGSGRAYWLRPVPAGPVEGWALAADTLPFLDPGEQATLHARLHLLPDRLNPQQRKLDVRLAVAQAYGEPQPLPPLAITVQPPILTIKEVRLLRDRDQQALAVTLRNVGAGLARTVFRVAVPGMDQTPESTLPALGPQGEATVSFGLDSRFEAPRGLKVALIGQHLGLPDAHGFPLYDWQWDALPVALPGWPWAVYVAALLALVAVAAGVRYQHLYRNPLVLRLTAQPRDLRELDVAELSDTQRALARVKRLEPVLRTAGVPAPWLSDAARFDRLPDAEARARALGRRLDCPLAEAGDADGSRRWSLNLGDDFVLNLPRLRLELPEAQQVAQDVVNHLGRVTEVTLLIGATPQQRRELARHAANGQSHVVVPTGADLTRLLLAEKPLDALAQLIARHVPVTQISPYQTGGGVQKKSLFFGRAGLIAQVMGREPANYLVVGGRQLGKSSLLKEIERRYGHDAKVDCHYMALSDAQAPERIAAALGLPAGSPLDAVLDHLRRRSDRRTLLLLDEADTFVEADRQNGYATLQRLRALGEEGRAHFILAGFWSLYRQVSMDYQSPLKNFGTVLQVGALEAEACKALATEPMGLVGIGWESPELVDRLIRETGQRANLISLACDEALGELAPTERVLNVGHLATVLAGTRIRNALAGWSELGADEAECRLDRIAVYASVKQDRFSLTELHAALEHAGLSVQPEALRQSLARLELAFVLARTGQQFQYQVPLQRAQMLEEDTDYLLRSEIRSMPSV